MSIFPQYSEFRYLYKNGRLPVALDFRRKTLYHELRWLVDLQKIDVEHYLPLFCSALYDPDFPFNLLAREGAVQLVRVAGDRVLAVLPELVHGIKKALITEQPEVIVSACRIIQELATVTPLVGLALIKHYRELLIPVFSKYKSVRLKYRRGEVHYGQRKDKLSDVINRTLDILDRTGGPDAYVEIKYAVPTFQSVYHNL